MLAQSQLGTAHGEAVRHFDDYANSAEELMRHCAQILETRQKLLSSLETQRTLIAVNQSFNLQYLLLQQQMQEESRRFALLSNIMKTKHDTAKNSINNLR